MPSDEPKVNILLVDDHRENLLSLQAVLEPLGENLVQATSGEEALRFLLERNFAAIILDVQMPGMDGFETASLIRSRRRSRQTPIIFLTAFSSSPQLLFQGYSLGAVDYLHKPLDPVILTSKVRVFVDLFKKTLALQQQSEALEHQAVQLAAVNFQLKQSEEQFRLLSTCSPVGIFVSNKAGRLVYVNPRYEEICGDCVPVQADKPSSASKDRSWLNLVAESDYAKISQQWANYMQQETEFFEEFQLQLPNGALRWVQLRSRPMFSDEQLVGHVGTLEDISARKQAEALGQQMLREQIARQEAEATNRMKDEFLAVLSHELRTPLNAMLGWAKLLTTRTFDTAMLTRGLQTIERNAIAQSQLIEDILDVSKIIRGALQLKQAKISPIAVIEAAIEAVRPQAEAKGVQLIPELQATDVLIWADSTRLQQIVWNLLTNAIKFTPRGNQVLIKFWIDAEHNTAQIVVRDTGIGIAPKFLPYVFDRFRQADSSTTRSYSGLGLGLAIVHHLVELHHGTILAESEGEGKGATFTVQLPLHQPDVSSLQSSIDLSESQIA